MKDDITKRIIDEAKYIIRTNNTIRETALKFNVSKSTVHKDMQDRLKYINRQLYEEVFDIMQQHISIRHIRGGESTRKKYAQMR